MTVDVWSDEGWDPAIVEDDEELLTYLWDHMTWPEREWLARGKAAYFAARSVVCTASFDFPRALLFAAAAEAMASVWAGCRLARVLLARVGS